MKEYCAGGKRSKLLSLYRGIDAKGMGAEFFGPFFPLILIFSIYFMIPETIIDFITSQTCATICCVGSSSKDPYCFSAFFMFDEQESSIYFKTSPTSFHTELLNENHFVAGTIHPDKLDTLLVRGLQFRGVAVGPNHPLSRRAAIAYSSKFPMSNSMPGEIWTIRLSHIKMTDSSRSFGEKIVWTRAEERLHVM